MTENLYTRPVDSWFETMNWKAFPFQKEVWSHYQRGRSGLLYTTTGSGKTYAAFLAPVLEWLNLSGEKKRGCKVIWITPLRALANDILVSMEEALAALDVPWQVEIRTGDTSSYRKRRQLKSLPDVLITTPESLTLLLSYEESLANLKDADLLVLDEWHELLGTKRGVQTELALARMRALSPALKVWALSATIGNADEALRVMAGADPDLVADSENAPRIVKGDMDLRLELSSLLPDEIELFPFAGHLNTVLLPRVVETIQKYESTLLFTNTRSQAERWYQNILSYCDDLAGQIAVHHGSLDQDIRKWLEGAISGGRLKCVICTSSLDLGVDFSPVDHVIQLGSPKGIARLLQRGGRSGHRPGQTSLVTFVPTNCLELIELSAAREAISRNELEGRKPLAKPLDVLAQHLVTIAAGGGFKPEELFEEVSSTYAYKDLPSEEWRWVLEFVHSGGSSLGAYPEYRKLESREERFHIFSKQIAARHRMSIGTITSDSSMVVQFQRGKRLGLVEESFVSRMKPGDTFIFGGRVLELLRVKDMVAYVRNARKKKATLVRYMGGKMPLSSELASAVREKLDQASKNIYADEEMLAVKPVLELQRLCSQIPRSDTLLVEKVESADGSHLFFYPFEGRNVHEGLSALIAYRISKQSEISFTISVNDYGFELLSTEPIQLSVSELKALFSIENLEEDITSSINSAEMSRRHFREIARVAGLVFQGYPGAGKSSRQIQASSELFFDVFKEYEPDNLLLRQAEREIMSHQLEKSRLLASLRRIESSTIELLALERPSPLAFPLMVDRLREKISSEKFEVRVSRMQLSLENHARRLYKNFKNIRNLKTHERAVRAKR